jgi:endonuclease/exonuclease/phosphatase family metal-dependent hydrolase
VSLLVRTWNVFHGMSSPPDRHSHLRQAIRLATEDEPGAVCLQEVPAWGLDRLAEWSGMQAFGAVAKRPLLPRDVGRTLTALNQGLLRSLLVGQANAILLRNDLRVLATDEIVLNPPSFRRRTARELALGRRTRSRWAKERRVCHAVRLEGLAIANLHGSATHNWSVADAELLRAATFLEAFAEPGDVLVLAGDFNVIREHSSTYSKLAEWGFTKPISWIDQVLVRGAPSTPAHRWPDERRVLDGKLLSDHAPVEVTIE